MYSFSFNHIADASEIDFSKSVIWVFYADKTPPHIGFSVQNTFFSLKVSGKDEQLNAQNVLELINRKKIPALFIQLSSEITLSETENTYQDYECAVVGISTCLTPIKNLLHQKEATQLSDLLHRMNSEITQVSGVHLPENYNALPSYSVDEIDLYIRQLSNYVEK